VAQRIRQPSVMGQLSGAFCSVLRFSASSGRQRNTRSQDLFTLIVTMAIVTTMAMPTMLRWSLKRLPLRNKERLRLEREELDAKGFVTNLERLLLATDDSANGKFAVELAGIIAGSGGKPPLGDCRGGF
jgi:hypothetical protein